MSSPGSHFEGPEHCPKLKITLRTWVSELGDSICTPETYNSELRAADKKLGFKLTEDELTRHEYNFARCHEEGMYHLVSFRNVLKY